MAKQRTIVWTEYMKYRARLRGFDLVKIEDKVLVMIPYETDEDSITPITIHITTRQQINFRLKTGRFTYEQ